MTAETIKLVLIWLHCLHALLCIAFIADLIRILLLIGFYRWFFGAARQICFIQSEALPRSGQWHVISMEFLHPFFRRQFAWKSVGRRLFSKALLFREGSGGPAPLIFRPKSGPKGGKKFFGDRPTPTYIRVWMTAPPPLPLIWRSGFATDNCIYFSVNPCRKQSWTSPKSLKLPLQFVAHSFHQVWINQMFSLVNLGSVMLFLPR